MRKTPWIKVDAAKGYGDMIETTNAVVANQNVRPKLVQRQCCIQLCCSGHLVVLVYTLDGPDERIQLMQITSSPHYVHASGCKNDAKLSQTVWLEKENAGKTHRSSSRQRKGLRPNKSIRRQVNFDASQGSERFNVRLRILVVAVQNGDKKVGEKADCSKYDSPG